MDRVAWRSSVLLNHFSDSEISVQQLLRTGPCLAYEAPESNSGKAVFDVQKMRELLDGHDVETRTHTFDLMLRSDLFHAPKVGDTVYMGSNYDDTMDNLREKTLQRLIYLRDNGVFKGFLTDTSPEGFLKMGAIFECLALFDHALSIKLGVHMHLWGGAITHMGTKRHHEKWLQLSEDYEVRGCFAMSELGHGSNVRGIETLTTYDPSTQEFVMSTPCESAQKYWIGGAAKHATHTVVFSQLHIGGKNEGVHAFIVQLRDKNMMVVPGVRIADCGHKIGLNGVDNGRIWFDNVRIPRENLLNSVADVTPEGHYDSAIKDPDQRFGAFMAPLTTGRVIISVSAIYECKMALATAIRYALSRRAFSLSNGKPEVLLLDYPSHQHRLLPLLAKTYAMSFAANSLKSKYVHRTPEDAKTIHVLSSGIKALLTWHNLRTLQECREACGGQGLKTSNRIGQAKAEFDVQLTFEGDNNVLMQQVSKALLADYFSAQRARKPLTGLGLEHMNDPRPSIPGDLNQTIVRSSAFQIALFQLRERELLERLAEEVARRVALGSSSVVAANESYQLTEKLGHAYSEKAVLDSFLLAENKQTGAIKELFGLLRTLYVLSLVQETTVFLRYGLLTQTQLQIVDTEVADLCKEIRPLALPLVESFGIPPELLGPIAFDWIEYNSWKNEKA